MAKNIILKADGAKIVLDMPLLEDDRAMTPPEQYLASCYAVWLAAQEGEIRATVLRDSILGLATNLLWEHDDEKPN